MLSYIISTRNKLPYLKIGLSHLLRHMENDDEVIVIDGNSTDGTSEYIRDLYDQGKINRYLSEKDHGEAHGFNKGIMMSTKPLIKILTDDDAFSFDAIRKCKTFMLSHTDVDVLASDGAATTIYNPEKLKDLKYEEDYLAWQKDARPYAFCGLGLMIRRSAIPLLGLISTRHIGVDAEYSMRITSMKIKLAWCTGQNWIRITNPKSNGITYRRQMALELYKLHQFYSSNRFSSFSGYFDYILSPVKAYLLKCYAFKNPVPESIFLEAYRKHCDAINLGEARGSIAS